MSPNKKPTLAPRWLQDLGHWFWSLSQAKSQVLMLAVVTVYTTFTGYQVCVNMSTLRSVERAERATRARERPLVVFDGVEIRRPSADPSALISIGAKFRNVGSMPAKDFTGRVSGMALANSVDFPSAEPADFISYGITQEQFAKTVSRSVVAPQQTTRFWAATDKPLSNATVSNASTTFYVWGHAEYEFGGDHHKTLFCVIVERDFADWTYCPSHNEAD